MHVYIDEEFEAESLDDLKAQVLKVAETAWADRLAFEASRAARGPIEPGPFDWTGAMDAWERDMVANVTHKSPLFER